MEWKGNLAIGHGVGSPHRQYRSPAGLTRFSAGRASTREAASPDRRARRSSDRLPGLVPGRSGRSCRSEETSMSRMQHRQRSPGRKAAPARRSLAVDRGDSALNGLWHSVGRRGHARYRGRRASESRAWRGLRGRALGARNASSAIARLSRGDQAAVFLIRPNTSGLSAVLCQARGCAS
jgi:hypothetical protein